MLKFMPDKFLMLVAVMLLPLVGHAGFKEPPGTARKEHLIGPATVGQLTLTQTGPDAALSFSGNCKGEPVSLVGTIQSVTVANLTADDLEDQRPGSSDELGVACYPIIVDLIVNTVTAFSNNGTTVVANIVAMGVVPAK